jgi:hypothetical protein
MPDASTEPDLHVVTTAVSAMNVAYWRDVDMNLGRRAHEFFVEQGAEYTIQDKTLKGRKAIQDFYEWRARRGVRTSRHCILNLHIEPIAHDRAAAEWILLLYAADGKPILPTASPILIADAHDVCVRAEDGVWRYLTRRISSVFAGGVVITTPPDDAARL